MKKGEFQAGSLAIYCEIDSFIPNSIAPFLTRAGHEPKEYNGVKGERLKTVKLRGQISQGLLLPNSLRGSDGLVTDALFGEGDDVTDFLWIKSGSLPSLLAPMSRLRATSPLSSEKRIKSVYRISATLKKGMVNPLN